MKLHETPLNDMINNVNKIANVKTKESMSLLGTVFTVHVNNKLLIRSRDVYSVKVALNAVMIGYNIGARAGTSAATRKG